MKYRTEWKYVCDEYQLDLLENKIRAVLGEDSHAHHRKYRIRSLYFDDYINRCAFDNDSGSSRRFKWRIRYYDDDNSFIKLEKKEKKMDLCLKRVSVIKRQECEAIMEGKISDVLWNTDDRLVKEFCIDQMNRLFRPKIIIDYERTAYVEDVGNVRITFDKNISGSLEKDMFLQGDYLRYPVQEKGKHVLEVKFDDVLPHHIERILHSENLQRNTFSKYYLGRLVLERNYL